MKKAFKTHKGTAKRFRRRGSGILLRGRAGTRHLLSHKSSKRKRSLDRSIPLHKRDAMTIQRLLPYH